MATRRDTSHASASASFDTTHDDDRRVNSSDTEEGGEEEEKDDDDDEEEEENSQGGFCRNLYYTCGSSRKEWSLGPVLDPRAKWVREWNRIFLLVCAAGLFVDPLFLYTLSISDTAMCLFVDGWLAITVTVLRCMTDALHVWNMWLQVKTAKRSPFGGGMGGATAGDRGLRDTSPRSVALRYFKSKKGFFFDLFVILPLPQVLLWVVIPSIMKEGSVTLVMTVLLIIFLFQYLPKLYHSVCLLRRLQNLSGYIFGTVWWGIALNLIAYFVAAHAAGACWYLLGIQRATKCLKEECRATSSCTGLRLLSCKEPIFYGMTKMGKDRARVEWAKNNHPRSICLQTSDNYDYGAYKWTVQLVSNESRLEKILFPIFWGLMTLSTFGNLESTTEWLEVVFNIIVLTSGLLLVTMLIGNIKVLFAVIVMSSGKEVQTPQSAATASSTQISSAQETNVLLAGSSSNGPVLGKVLNNSLAVKLSEVNYTLWKSMTITVLRGQRLDGFILGTKAPPSEFIAFTNQENSTIEMMLNPVFEEWSTVDQALLGWLLSSMEPTIAIDIIHHRTSREVWKALEGRFGSANKARINQLRQLLQTTRKGGLRMVEFLATMKQIGDGLSLAGEPVGPNYLISSVLAGLDAEYLPVICQLNSRENTWEEVHATLTAFEHTLAHLNVIPAPTIPSNTTAFVATSRPNNSNSNFSPRNQNNSQNQNNGRGPNRGNFRGRYRGRGGRNQPPRQICQLCGKAGHIGPYCYNRYDPNYMGSTPEPTPTAAFVATPEVLEDPSWVADSGATNHVTNDQGQNHASTSATRET